MRFNAGMGIVRIVANLASQDPRRSAAFYRDLFGLDLLMDLGWITTAGGAATMPLQVSFATEGGAGTPVPALSIEVDDLDEVLARADQIGAVIRYGPVIEPWGVRRFFVEDPDGHLVNVLVHHPA